MPMKIASDRLAKHKKEMQKMMNYSMGEPEYIPVDLNGARVFSKGEVSLDEVQSDIRERFDMDYPKGGE